MESALRLGHLGSQGSFSEEAALAYARRVGKQAALRGAATPAAVLELLESGDVENAVLPVANTAGGLVWPTLAALGRHALELLDEVVLPVRFSLLALPGVELATIECVASHPQAFRQCAGWLERALPGRPTLPWSDTASAARDLAAGALGERAAVLASTQAGELHGLVTLASDVHDRHDNRTFFAVLGRARVTTIE